MTSLYKYEEMDITVLAQEALKDHETASPEPWLLSPTLGGVDTTQLGSDGIVYSLYFWKPDFDEYDSPEARAKCLEQDGGFMVRSRSREHLLANAVIRLTEELAQLQMQLDNAKHINSQHIPDMMLSATREACAEVERDALKAENARLRECMWESWGDLGSLSLQVGDVVDENDVKLWEAHVEAIATGLNKQTGNPGRYRPRTCQHFVTVRGKDYPLIYGSHQTKI